MTSSDCPLLPSHVCPPIVPSGAASPSASRGNDWNPHTPPCSYKDTDGLYGSFPPPHRQNLRPSKRGVSTGEPRGATQTGPSERQAF